MPIPTNYPINYLSTCLMIRDRIVARDSMPEISISRLITELRVSLGLTQEQFAARLGVTLSTVNRWENGKGKPSPLAMLRIKELQKNLKQNKPSK